MKFFLSIIAGAIGFVAIVAVAYVYLAVIAATLGA